MLHSIKIEKPYKGLFGSKINFKLPNNISEIKSVYLLIDNLFDLQVQYQSIVPARDNSYLNFYNYSLILNNGTDECLTDINGSYNHFCSIGSRIFSPFRTTTRKNEPHYKHEKVIINRKLITNAVHTIVFKMPQLFLNDIKRGSDYRNYMNYVAENMKATLFLETN